MLKEVDFTAIVFKVAFLWILLSLGCFCSDSQLIFAGGGAFHAGWSVFLILLLIACCFKAVRATPETEETRRVTEFVFRLWGLFQSLCFLSLYHWIQWWLVEGKGAVLKGLWAMSKDDVIRFFLFVGIMVYGLSTLLFPGFWNRAILLIGGGIRRFIEKEREG